LYSHYLAWQVQKTRQREIEQRLRLGPRPLAPPRSNRIRRRLGLELIRIGSGLATDGPRRLAARR